MRENKGIKEKFSEKISLGAHMSMAAGFLEAAKMTAEGLGANAMQIFMKSPRGRGQTKLTPPEAAEFKKYTAARGIEFVVAHGSYLLNLAKPIDPSDSWPIQSLVEDLRSMALMGGAGVVLHTGKTLDLPYAEAERHLVHNLQWVLRETADLNSLPHPPHILLETMAGQGTEMGTTAEQMASILEKLGHPPRVSLCLDTCHAFAAGYDFTTPAGVAAAMESFDRAVGLNRITLFHFNDSMKECGSRVDRHENLGFGKIGIEGLRALARFAAEHGIPMVLETPIERHSHSEDLKVLRGMLH